MDRILATVIVFVSLSLNAEAGIRPLGRLFKLVPESQAHTSFGKARDSELSHDSIKVLVWNIKKTSKAPWKSEFTRYGKDRDLFLLQEAYENELFDTTLRSFDDVRWDMGISFLYRLYNDAATGSMVGSKVEPTFVEVLHTPDLEPVVATPKATTVGKYAVEGSQKELLVISIHGINITSFGSFTRHMAQIKALIDNHDGPVLLAGDFNTRTAARSNYLMSMTKALGMDTVEFRNGECRMKFKFTPNYLDHSFVRGLKVKDSSVDCESRGSDHKPLMLELAIAE